MEPTELTPAEQAKKDLNDLIEGRLRQADQGDAISADDMFEELQNELDRGE